VEVRVAKVDWKDADGTIADEPQYVGKNIYSVVFTYTVDDHFYGGTFTTGDTYRKGDSITVQYDPMNPERNDWVVKETRQHWIFGIGVAVAVVIFVLFLIF
jgi:hypothetical protein